MHKIETGIDSGEISGRTVSGDDMNASGLSVSSSTISSPPTGIPKVTMLLKKHYAFFVVVDIVDG